MDSSPGQPSTRIRLATILGSLALAGFQVAGTFGAAHNQTDRTDVDAIAVSIALLGPLSLILLRRWPVVVMWFVSAITLLYLLIGYAYGPVFASLVIVAIYNVAGGHRTTAWAAFAGLFVIHFTFTGLVRDERWSWIAFFGVMAWALLILSIGEIVRIRRERVVAGRRARAESERRQANEERLRIARELHDVVAHHMSLINVQAGVALHIVDRKPEQAQTALAAIKDASKEALVELRSLVGVLRAEGEAAPRTPVGKLDALDDLVERSAHAGLTVRKTIEGVVRPLPSAVELAALRIVQEAITNVVRHSGAERADVTLHYAADTFTVDVEDDGHGFLVSPGDADGSGIVGMRERADALGGSLVVGPGSVGGARVSATFPLGDDT